MTITFKLSSRVLKGGKKTIRLRVYNRVKDSIQDFKITTGLKVNPKYWDKDAERVTKNHPDSAIINNKLSEIKQRRESLLNKFDADALSFDAVCSQIMSNSDTNTLDDFIEFKIKEIKGDNNYKNYKEKLAGFKKLVGHKGKLEFSALAKNHLILQAHTVATKRQKDGTLASRSYSGYMGTLKTIVDLASYLDYTDIKLNIPSIYMTLNRSKDKNRNLTQNKGNIPEDVLSAIDQCTTIQQWEAISYWFLQFCLRGFYYADIVKGLRQVNIEDVKSRKVGNVASTFFQDKIFINHHRSKTEYPMYIHIFNSPTYSLINKLKYVAVYTHAEKQIGGQSVLADINDPLAIFDYDYKSHSYDHDQMWRLKNRKSSLLGLKQINARKTFNQMAQRLEISEEVRGLLLGQSSNRLLAEHYNSNRIPELLARVDKAHSDILALFKSEEIYDKLLIKLKSLMIKQNLPEWITCEGRAKIEGRDITVVTGVTGGRKNPHFTYCKVIEPKYRKYFLKQTTNHNWSESYYDDVLATLKEFIDAENRVIANTAMSKN